MFVFTDAGASDDTPQNVENLKAEAAQHDSAITFFTNQRGCGSGKNRLPHSNAAAKAFQFKFAKEKDLISKRLKVASLL